MSLKGVPFTEEHKKKLSDKRKSWWAMHGPMTDEHKAALSRATKGVARNPTGVLIPRSITFRNSNLKRFHGKNIEQYQRDLEAQGGVCAICKRAPQNESLVYDHDHRCCGGKKSCAKCTRNLLCHKCNRALGFFEDDIKLLESAIKYLKFHAGKTE